MKIQYYRGQNVRNSGRNEAEKHKAENRPKKAANGPSEPSFVHVFFGLLSHWRPFTTSPLHF